MDGPGTGQPMCGLSCHLLFHAVPAAAHPDQAGSVKSPDSVLYRPERPAAQASVYAADRGSSVPAAADRPSGFCALRTAFEPEIKLPASGHAAQYIVPVYRRIPAVYILILYLLFPCSIPYEQAVYGIACRTLFARHPANSVIGRSCNRILTKCIFQNIVKYSRI